MIFIIIALLIFAAATNVQAVSMLVHSMTMEKGKKRIQWQLIAFAFFLAMVIAIRVASVL